MPQSHHCDHIYIHIDHLCVIFSDHLSRYRYNSSIVYLRLTHTVTGSMRLINIDVFFQRESLIHSGKQLDRRAKVLEFRDDEATEYAILSHRWIDSFEVDYEEMIYLGKMGRQQRDEIRNRPGYKKILDACKQAQTDGYEWIWVDTCCIDKRSSAELSEAINSMYRWYGNARVCYAYLHDVDGSFIPIDTDRKKYHMSNGRPEWFSRGWTLQEMIAPRDLQFFNKDWRPIGDKKALAVRLNLITGVPKHILVDGLEGNRPCVAQIISWAAKRTTTRVEDRAYSLMGLLDVNMPMLYGEGMKAFHRLQLEIIRSSDDQSIFAWDSRSSSVRIGSVLADDPSFFEDCADMELQNYDEFMEDVPELSSTSTDHFGVFPITNRGIQIWMLLRPYCNSNSVFRAYLPCSQFGYGMSETINLVLCNSNYYRYPSRWDGAVDQKSPAEFRQVYLRYQDTNPTVTFDIDDSGIIENGFACSHVDPKNLTGNTFTLTNANPSCVRSYSEERGTGSRFKVAVGQWLGLDWAHLDHSSFNVISHIDKGTSIAQGLNWAVSMADIRSRGRLWIRYFRLFQSTWIVRTYRVRWERSKVRLRMEVFRGSYFKNPLDEWKAYDVEVGDFLVHVDYYHGRS